MYWLQSPVSLNQEELTLLQIEPLKIQQLRG